MSERKQEAVKEKGRKRNKSPRAKQVWKMAFLSLDFDAELVVYRVAAGRLEPEGKAEVQKITIVSDAVGGTKVDLDGRSFQEERMGKPPRKWKRSKGADWTEMRKEEKKLKCTLLNGSAWSTEKKYMRRYTGTFDIFFR